MDPNTIPAITDSPIAAVFSSAQPSEPTQTPAATLRGYLALVQAATEGNSPHRANTNQQAQQALAPFALSVAQWQQAVNDFERLFRRVAGAAPAMETFVEQIGRQRRIDTAGARLLSFCKKAA